jgi:hypothetical protein
MIWHLLSEKRTGFAYLFRKGAVTEFALLAGGVGRSDGVSSRNPFRRAATLNTKTRDRYSRPDRSTDTQIESGQ